MAGLSPLRSRMSIGALFLIPGGTGPDPRRIGKLKDVKISPSLELAILQGENNFVEDAAIKGSKIDGEIGFTHIDASLYMTALPGAVKSTGAEDVVLDESSTIPTTPFSVTVTGSATFSVDLGVRDVTASIDLECVPSAPATGQYSYTAGGVYTFAAADTGHTVRISYTKTAATGETITISQSMSEANAVFYALKAYNKTNGATEVLTLNKILISGMEWGWTMQDWAKYGLKFMALPDANGVVGTIKRSA